MSEHDGSIRKMMIILSKATLENVYAAFVLANGARMEGIEAEIFAPTRAGIGGEPPIAGIVLVVVRASPTAPRGKV